MGCERGGLINLLLRGGENRLRGGQGFYHINEGGRDKEYYQFTI